MFTVGPTFFSGGGVVGDHLAGDGLTTLQTTFAGGSSVDLSPYARGVGTNSDPVQVVVSDGKLTIFNGGGLNRSLSWGGNNLGRLPNTGYTAEFFVRIVESSVNPASSANALVSLAAWNMANSRLGMNGFSGGINPYFTEALAWYSYTGPEDIFVKFAAYTHVAFVSDNTTNGSVLVYIAGQRVVNYAPGSLQLTAPYSGAFSFGSTNGASLTTEFSGVRIRHAQMYAGASFTPPTSPAAWGPP